MFVSLAVVVASVIALVALYKFIYLLITGPPQFTTEIQLCTENPTTDGVQILLNMKLNCVLKFINLFSKIKVIICCTSQF